MLKLRNFGRTQIINFRIYRDNYLFKTFNIWNMYSYIWLLLAWLFELSIVMSHNYNLGISKGDENIGNVINGNGRNKNNIRLLGKNGTMLNETHKRATRHF